MAVLLALAIILGACGGGGGDNKAKGVQGGQEGTTAAVAAASDERPDKAIQLSADTVVVAGNRGKTVRSFGADGKTIVIDAKANGADGLAAGKILLLTGVTVVRVASLHRDGENVTIEGAPVTLPEVIQNGKLSWDQANVDAGSARMLLIDDGSAGNGSGGGNGDTTVPTLEGGGVGGIINGINGGLTGESGLGIGAKLVLAAPPLVAGKTISGQAGKLGFDISYTPEGRGHHLHLTLKPSGDLAGTIAVDVTITSLANSGTAEIVEGHLQNFDFNMADMGGKAVIETSLQGLQNVAHVTTPPFFKLPFSIEFPALVGGIPFTLSLKSTIQVALSMALANSTLGGRAEITFDGPAGFHFKGGSVTLDGKRSQDSPNLLEFVKGAAPGPVGIVLTTEMPKVGFGFGFLQTGAGLFIANGMVASQTILPAPAACTAMNMAYVLAGGVEAKFLGKEFEIARKAFVDKRWSYQVPQDQRCNAPK